MKVIQWLAINKRGIVKIRKTKPSLEWNEIAFKLEIKVPDELFVRPHIEAILEIKDIPNVVNRPDIIINTKELIEQQTGAKIDFRVIEDKSDE